MVYCDGGCEDWYHCSCVKVDEADAKELLDRFICPRCTTDTLFTTWKRMCRVYNVPTIKCRRAARVVGEPPSMYCSDEHTTAFWEYAVSLIRTDSAPTRGGALNREELAKLLGACKSAEDFHALGQKPRLPKKEGADPSETQPFHSSCYLANKKSDRSVGLDHLTPDEQKQIEEIKEKKQVLEQRLKGFLDQQKLLIMINERAKIAAKQPDLEVKDICGYDSRLVFNEAEFQSWLSSDEGKRAFEIGVLGPRTAATKEIGATIPHPDQEVPEVPEVSDALDNVCLRLRKRCRHNNWRDIHGQDYVYMQRILREELKKLSEVEAEIIDDAETREATKGYYADNVTIQLF